MGFIEEVVELFSRLVFRKRPEKPKTSETAREVLPSNKDRTGWNVTRVHNGTIGNYQTDRLFVERRQIRNTAREEYNRNYIQNEYASTSIYRRNLELQPCLTEYRKVTNPVRVTYNSEMITELMMYSDNYKFNCVKPNLEIPYTLVNVNPYTPEYIQVNNLFKLAMRRGYSVRRIVKIENPYILLLFHLTKHQKLQRRLTVVTESLFHGTSEENVHSICSENFDWRLNGTSVGHLFGHGVSFAQRSYYASYYPRDDVEMPRVMFVAQVMIGRKCHGTTNMVIPPTGFDTTIKPDGNVIVKYEDHEFYPDYLIYYS